MTITSYRQQYTPFEYPQYWDAHQKALGSIWRVQEVKMQADLIDWLNATETEREVIGGILRGFTLMETHIGDYWSDTVAKMFPKHEIVALCRTFATFEVIHAEAYNHLSETLGINEYEAFLADEVAQRKLAYFMSPLQSPKVSLAVFSGVGEGVSLFSSFAALLHFSRRGRFKGLAQIISWSALDEGSHSDLGIQLFNDLVAETGITKEEINQIVKAFHTVLENELAFIDNVFSKGSIDGLDSLDLKEFIKYKANERLKKLHIHHNIHKIYYDRNRAKRIRDWFEPMTLGQSSADFFAHEKSGDNYIAKPVQDLMSIDLSTLKLGFENE